MSPILKKTLNFISRAFRWSTSIATTSALSVLSFVGALFLWPSLLFASIVFLLNGLVEYLMYKKTIDGGVKKTFKPKVMKDEFLDKEIDLLLDADPRGGKFNNPNHSILQNYISLKEKCTESNLSKLEAADQAALLFARKTAKRLLVKEALTTESDLFSSEKKVILQTQIRRMRNIRAGLIPMYVLSAITFGLVTFINLQAALASPVLLSALGVIGISSLACPAWGLIVIASLAAIGFGFMTYHLAAKMICNFKTWKNNLNKMFAEKPADTKHPLLRKILLGTFTAILTLLGIAVTLATFGVWRSAVDTFIHLAPKIVRVGQWLIDLVSYSLVSMTMISNLSNSLTNCILSLRKFNFKDLGTALIKPFKDWFIDTEKTKKTWLQKCNPFAITARILEWLSGLMLPAHGASEGMMSIGEGLPVGKGAAIGVVAAQTAVDSVEHSNSFHHGRGASIVNFLIKYVALGPLKTIAALFDVALHRLSSKEPLSFNEAFRREFNIPKKVPVQKSITTFFTDLDPALKCAMGNKLLKSFEKTSASSTAQLNEAMLNKGMNMTSSQLEKVKNQIQHNKYVELKKTGVVQVTDEEFRILSIHRNGRKTTSATFFSNANIATADTRKAPHSIQLMQRLCGLALLKPN